MSNKPEIEHLPTSAVFLDCWFYFLIHSIKRQNIWLRRDPQWQEVPKVFEGGATLHFFWTLAGRTIPIKCLDNFYPASDVLPKFRDGEEGIWTTS